MKVELSITGQDVDAYLVPEDEAERRILWFVGEKEGTYEATTSFEGHPTNGKAKHLRLHFIKRTTSQLEELDARTKASLHGRSPDPGHTI